MDERHLRARAKTFERGLGRGIPATDDNNALPKMGVRLRIVVMHVGQVFAGHTDQIRMIVVADGQQNVSRVPGAPHST